MHVTTKSSLVSLIFFTVEKGGGSEGAGRVCANIEKGTQLILGTCLAGGKVNKPK